MASTAFTAHLPALGEHVREETGAELQATLARADRPRARRQAAPLEHRRPALQPAPPAPRRARRLLARPRRHRRRARSGDRPCPRRPGRRDRRRRRPLTARARAVEDHAVLADLVDRINTVAEHAQGTDGQARFARHRLAGRARRRRARARRAALDDARAAAVAPSGKRQSDTRRSPPGASRGGGESPCRGGRFDASGPGGAPERRASR